MKHSDETPQQRATHTPETFAAWFRDELIAAGYNLSGQRGGGQTRAARDSGISRATLSRMLRGEGTTDTKILAQLADFLGVALAEVLVRAGVLTTDDLQAVAHRGRPPITPEEAADELGITDPQARRIYLATVEALRNGPADERQAEQ